MKKFFPAFFVVLLASFAAEGRIIDRTAALVNSDVILASDIELFRKNISLRREIDPYMSLTGFSGSSDKEILEYLIQEKIVLQKFTPNEEEVEEEINSVQRNNRIDRERLREVLLSQGVKFEDYRRLMSVSVAKRKLIDRDLRPLAIVTDEDVKNYYYTEAAAKSRLKEQKLVLTYTLQQLLLPSASVRDLAQKRIQAGEDFDSIAAELSSQGAESSKLPAISEDNMNPKIREAIAGLKVGATTKPMPTGSGYMILKITEIGAPKDPVFEREKEQVRAMLFQKALINQLKLWTDRNLADSYIRRSST
jgi:parvulin-like peptidyl-prolyl isomerase